MSDMFANISPALPIIFAGLIAAVVPNNYVRKGLALLAPVLAGLCWYSLEIGTYGVIDFGGFTLETLRFDEYSRIWSLIFIIAAFLNGLYGLHEKDRVTDAAGLIYAGGALGAVFAGDLMTL
ncbi:MAG: multicomponent Na+:H+ antiporter subunit D, partial [Maricaulis sp.]